MLLPLLCAFRFLNTGPSSVFVFFLLSDEMIVADKNKLNNVIAQPIHSFTVTVVSMFIEKIIFPLYFVPVLSAVIMHNFIP